MPVGKEYTEQSIHVNKYINITIRIHNLQKALKAYTVRFWVLLAFV